MIRPSKLPYRIGVLRRARATVALLLLTAAAGILVALVALAVIAGLASAISSSSS